MAITNNYDAQETVKSQIKTLGNVYSTGGKVGYGTGAGSIVTQGTNRTTAVTIDAQCGAITLISAAGSTSVQSFTVTNSCCAVTDMVVLCQKSGTDKMDLTATAVADGSFQISFRTMSGTTTEQPVIVFMILKGVIT